MYVTALTETFAANNELVGLCDPSPTRMAYYNRQIAIADRSWRTSLPCRRV